MVVLMVAQTVLSMAWMKVVPMVFHSVELLVAWMVLNWVVQLVGLMAAQMVNLLVRLPADLLDTQSVDSMVFPMVEHLADPMGIRSAVSLVVRWVVS